MAERYGLGDALFDPPKANVEYVSDVIHHCASRLLGTRVVVLVELHLEDSMLSQPCIY